MFDIGIAGPLAGLAVAAPIIALGVWQFDPQAKVSGDLLFGFSNPLALQWILRMVYPDCSAEAVARLSDANPMLIASWAAMLVTGLNMLPVSQLDGGHVAHALLGRCATWLARGLLIGAIAFVLVSEQYAWVVMVVLVTLIGVDHPPTADDQVRLGRFRRVVGWMSLLIPILCLPSMELP